MKKLDRIFLVTLLCSAFFSAKGQQLVDKKATKETKNLYHNLKNLQGKEIFFGHQDATAYGIAWKYEPNQADVKKVTGDFPAVYGWEIGHLETGDTTSIDNVRFSKIKQLIIEAYQRGGINTISWHLRNPLTGGSSWDITNNQVVKEILPNGSKHVVYKQWLDRLADFFNDLKTANGIKIPILFRPFHEHSGSWFWWGKKLCTKEEYIQLYQFTTKYLRDVKKIHHLIYIYSPDFVDTKEEYLDRFPGDDYIDILGQDLYHRGGTETAQKYISDVQNVMAFLSEYANTHKKLFVFSETGLNQLSMNDWFTNVLYKAIEVYKPIYVLLWRNAYENPTHFYAPFPGHPAGADFIKFKALPGINFQNGLTNKNIYQK